MKKNQAQKVVRRGAMRCMGAKKQSQRCVLFVSGSDVCPSSSISSSHHSPSVCTHVIPCSYVISPACGAPSGEPSLVCENSNALRFASPQGSLSTPNMGIPARSGSSCSTQRCCMGYECTPRVPWPQKRLCGLAGQTQPSTESVDVTRVTEHTTCIATGSLVLNKKDAWKTESMNENDQGTVLRMKQRSEAIDIEQNESEQFQKIVETECKGQHVKGNVNGQEKGLDKGGNVSADRVSHECVLKQSESYGTCQMSKEDSRSNGIHYKQKIMCVEYCQQRRKVSKPNRKKMRRNERKQSYHRKRNGKVFELRMNKEERRCHKRTQRNIQRHTTRCLSGVIKTMTCKMDNNCKYKPKRIGHLKNVKDNEGNISKKDGINQEQVQRKSLRHTSAKKNTFKSVKDNIKDVYIKMEQSSKEEVHEISNELNQVSSETDYMKICWLCDKFDESCKRHMQCDKCNVWFHLRCMGFINMQERLMDTSVAWICCKCGQCNYCDNLFFDLGISTDDNVFDLKAFNHLDQCYRDVVHLSEDNNTCNKSQWMARL